MFEEYATVRVVQLIHTDRWTEGGTPSIGDQGTIVSIDTNNDEVWYTVESSTPKSNNPWLAEFTENELEPGSEVDIDSHLVPEPPSDDNLVSNSEEGLKEKTKIPGSKKAKSSSELNVSQSATRYREDFNLNSNKKGRVYSIILSGVLGALVPYLVASLVIPDYSTLIPVIAGCLTGVTGGYLAGNIGEAVAFIVIFIFISVCFFNVVSNTFGREIFLSLVIGVTVGNLCTSIYNEYSR